MGQSTSEPSAMRQKSLTSKGKTSIRNNGLGDISENAEIDDNNLGFKFHRKLTVNDFEFLKVVGKGSFGKVMMVRKRDDQKIYAMKVLKKKALVKRKCVFAYIHPLNLYTSTN